MQPIKQKHLDIYIAQDGKKPFVEWLEALDKTFRYRLKCGLIESRWAI